MDIQETEKYQNILQLAQERVDNLRYFSTKQWKLHNWFVALSLIASSIVPFGLAALLYVPDQYRNHLNIFLLIVSAIALIVGLFNQLTRLAYRATRNRRLYVRLETGLAKFQDGFISFEEFYEVFEEVTKGYIDEEL